MNSPGRSKRSFLAAAVVTVPLFSRLGVGVCRATHRRHPHRPMVLASSARVDAYPAFAELGVVLLLFVIGLELQPSCSGRCAA
jgi:predicted Kef-type K+ transport protein